MWQMAQGKQQVEQGWEAYFLYATENELNWISLQVKSRLWLSGGLHAL